MIAKNGHWVEKRYEQIPYSYDVYDWKEGKVMYDKLKPHHNNKGTRQIKRGKCRKSLKRIARKLKIKFKCSWR